MDIDAQKEAIEKAIEEFEKGLGLQNIDIKDSPKYLYMNLDDLKRKTPEELGEAMFALAQYHFFIQKLVDKWKSWRRWGYAKLDEVTSQNIQKIGNNYGFNERMLMAKNDGELAKKINKFIINASMRIDRLENVPANVKLMLDTLKDIKFTKQQRERYGS